MTVPLRLHDYVASCNCYKVRLLLANLGREYERVPVDIFAGETLTDAFAALNPARTTPVLELPGGRCLGESAGILAYLAEGTPFMPADPLERGELVGWLVYEQTDVVPMIGGLRFRLLTGRLRPDEPGAQRRRDGAIGVLERLDAHLSRRQYFVGDAYSIADIAIYGYTHVAREAGLDLEPYRHLGAWFARIERQPGYLNDVEPYGANARPGAGRSIYD